MDLIRDEVKKDYLGSKLGIGKRGIKNRFGFGRE
jgi:hypothetical protein